MTDQSPKPFKTPEQYFETLPDRIMAQLPLRDAAKETRSNTRVIHLRYWLSAAAVVLLGLFVWQTQTSAPPVADAQVLEEYLALQTISQHELIEGLTDEQIHALEISLFQPKNTEDEIH